MEGDILKITSQYWQQSEFLLNFFLPGLLLVSCIILFILFGVLSSNVKRKIVVSMIGIVLLVNVLSIGIIFKITANYRELSVFQTKKNRIVEVSLFRYESTVSVENKSYVLEDIEKTAKHPFYKIEEITEANDLTYLGKDQHLYFFERNKIIYNVDVKNELVSFEPMIENVQVIKSVAVLVDKTFEKNYFKETIGPVISKIIIPKEMDEIDYRAEKPTNKLLK